MMKKGVLLLLFFLCLASCKTEGAENELQKPESEMAFDQGKWQQKEGEDYPYRDKMFKSILYSQEVRRLNKEHLLELLGEADRVNVDHFYYTITQKRLGFWPLHTKTMVIKFLENDSIEWIKIHE